MANHLRREPSWIVRFPEHMCGRVAIPACTLRQYESSRRAALMIAVTDLHAKYGVAPWKPYMRHSARLAEVYSTGP